MDKNNGRAFNFTQSLLHRMKPCCTTFRKMRYYCRENIEVVIHALFQDMLPVKQ